MENGHTESISVELNGLGTEPTTSLSTGLELPGPEVVYPYEKKYFALLRRCTTLQQNNERLVNRLHHVKKLLGKLRHERRFLMRRLDHHQDNYEDIPLALPIYPELDENQNAGVSLELPLPSVTNRLSGKSSRSTAAATSIGKGSSSSSSWSSKGGTSGKRKKTRSSKSLSASNKKGISTITNPLQQKAGSNTTSCEVIVAQIKKEDTSNGNWNCTTENDSKKAYYDLYEHSYDLIAPAHPPLDDLGMNSIAIHESQGEPLS